MKELMVIQHPDPEEEFLGELNEWKDKPIKAKPKPQEPLNVRISEKTSVIFKMLRIVGYTIMAFILCLLIITHDFEELLCDICF